MTHRFENAMPVFQAFYVCVLRAQLMFCVRKPAAFAQSDSSAVYIVQLFSPFLRNSGSATIALSGQRWKWKWREFPEIQRVSFSPAQAEYSLFILIVRKNYS